MLGAMFVQIHEADHVHGVDGQRILACVSGLVACTGGQRHGSRLRATMGALPSNEAIRSGRFRKAMSEDVKPKPRRAIVVGMLIASSAMMAMAWLGHLRFESEWSFWTALGVSWMLVLPEYALNTAATRAGYGALSGAQMASIHLSGGVVCVALVSRIILDEPLTLRTVLGFITMFIAITLIMGEGSHAGNDGEGSP